MPPKVALQTFTIRRYLKSPGAIEGTCARVASLGLRAIELAYMPLEPSFIDALATASARHGIEVGSTQITYDFLDKKRDRVIDLHARLGCKITAVSVLPRAAILGGRDKLLQFCAKLDALGAWYRERGLQLCFHHHDFEFRRYGDEIGLNLILGNTDPNHVGLELDTYWAQRGGASPQDLIRDLDGRVKVVHLRDYRIRWKYFELLPADAELGQGNLDFKRIITACRDTGVRYIAIEQASKHPFESVAHSVEHLHQLGFSALFHNSDRENSR